MSIKEQAEATADEAQRVLNSIDGMDVFEDTPTGGQLERVHQATLDLAATVHELASAIVEALS